VRSPRASPANLPRFRYDQLLKLGWYFFFEIAQLKIFITALVLSYVRTETGPRRCSGNVPIAKPGLDGEDTVVTDDNALGSILVPRVAFVVSPTTAYKDDVFPPLANSWKSFRMALEQLLRTMTLLCLLRKLRCGCVSLSQSIARERPRLKLLSPFERRTGRK
jgi:hypothetical protein